MDRYLRALRRKREIVQIAIDEEYARPIPDGVTLSELKKVKLRLRERIEALEQPRFRPPFQASPAAEHRA
ncbi:MAG: DUF465 domain-containing protein [Rhizobiales bacterium PAR1]|nr:MAG: DUF465 domain-containing protein [Rhizobiales bacterium PAR1]